MRAILKTLLLIALLVQLPLSALATYSSLSDSYQHHHSHEAGGHSHQHDAEPTGASDENHALNECTTHHHCGGTHLSALPALSIQSSVITTRHVFDARSETLLASAAHTRIERPNWAIL